METRKRNSQAKFKQGEIVINRWSLPPLPPHVRLAVVTAWKQGGSWRYQLEKVEAAGDEKRTFYADEEILELPLLVM